MFFFSVLIFKFFLSSFIDFAFTGSTADFIFINLILRLLNVLTITIILLDFVVIIFFNLFSKAVNLVIASFLVGDLTLFFL